MTLTLALLAFNTTSSGLVDASYPARPHPSPVVLSPGYIYDEETGELHFIGRSRRKLGVMIPERHGSSKE